QMPGSAMGGRPQPRLTVPCGAGAAPSASGTSAMATRRLVIGAPRQPQPYGNVSLVVATQPSVQRGGCDSPGAVAGGPDRSHHRAKILPSLCRVSKFLNGLNRLWQARDALAARLCAAR